jgi:hypothetical protein
MRIRLSLESPVPIASKIGGPLSGLHDAGYNVAAAGLKQKYTDARVLSQPARYHRTRRARSANDELIVWP